MKVIRSENAGSERIVALGTFDGVHMGHRSLLRHGAEYARKAGLILQAVTFDRHPMETLHYGHGPGLLTTLPEKLRILYSLGIPEVRILPFSRRTAKMEPDDFLAWLREKSGIRAVIAGWNYSFGRGGRGDAEMLIRDGRKHGYEVIIEPPYEGEDGRTISSSLIRGLLRDGHAAEAGKLLGEAYSLGGTVQHGKHLGERLGFPTANLVLPEKKVVPGYGVYICTVEYGGREHPAVANIGMQPTAPSGQVLLEAHLLDATSDLYGTRIKVRLLERIRGEKRFDSPEALCGQIRRDIAKAEKRFRI